MKIYQTKKTREVLSRIEAISEVGWNEGQRPTEYLDDDYEYLGISEDPYIDSDWELNAKSLFSANLEEEWIQCTAEEFVGHCARLLPICLAQEGGVLHRLDFEVEA